MRLALLLGLVVSSFVWASVSGVDFDPASRTLKIHARFDAQENLPRTMGAGLPMLPYEPVHVAIPRGYTLDSSAVEHGQGRMIRAKVERASGQLPLSWHSMSRNLPAQPAPDFAGDLFPAKRFDVNLQKLHGVSIALVNVFPVVYHRSGFTDTIDEATVTLHLKEEAAAGSLRAWQRAEVEAFVKNPEVVTAWPENRAAGYDYLIVATPEMIGYTGADNLQDFQNNLTSRGLTSKIADITQVIKTEGLSSVPTVDDADKLRLYVSDEYASSGIRYVLLAGRGTVSATTPSIPSRLLWSKIRAYDGHWYDLEEKIPADHYFAALDGSFDGNKNGVFGEPADGEDGQDVDFLPEVTVGRVVLSSTAQLQAFVKKVNWSSTATFAKKTILSGELLFPEMGLYGDEYMDQLVGHCEDHGFFTDGYTSDWEATKLYDRPKQWSGADALKALKSSGVSMVNHLGHSNESYNMRMSSGSIASMTNEAPFFYYTQGCLAGRFTVGSFVDKLVSSPKAAFAAVGNSSYGLAPEDPHAESTKTPGASQMLHRQFIQSVIANPGASLAQAHQASKVAFVNDKAIQEVRWVTWVATFFGDPSLGMKF
ncbi:MAG: hypothetical protein HYZ71_02170 [Deltaproteobacteria bacterium]|nr:hypothetical protein [Deltaproteobacteria bacterium]